MRSNTNPTTILAREFRHTPNPSEQKLWTARKGKKLGGFKFTRQFPIGPYFADFACRRDLLLVELDGSQHIDNAYDAERDAFLLAEGYSILRLPSAGVLRNCEAACETILAALEGQLDEGQNFDVSYHRSKVEPRKTMRRRLFVANTTPRPRGRGGSRERARRGGCQPRILLSDSPAFASDTHPQPLPQEEGSFFPSPRPPGRGGCAQAQTGRVSATNSAFDNPAPRI